MKARFYSEARKCYRCGCALRAHTSGMRCLPCQQLHRADQVKVREAEPDAVQEPIRLDLWRETEPGPLLASMGVSVGRQELRNAA